MKKIRCALIGSGNIGTDLIYKIQRSPVLEPVWMVGIDPESEGLARAREMGLKTTAAGVDGLLPHVLDDNIQIAFDATSAYVHAENSRKLNELGVMMIDLTPAAIGPLCVPPVNLREHAEKLEMNVNMISCAGQATIPIVHAVSRVQSVAYGEIVASLASKSIGPGTRANLDEFTYTTSNAIEIVGGARKGKARVSALRDVLKAETEIGFHGHHNMGMGIANSIAAIEAGASRIDASVGGLGAGAGNTPLEAFVAVCERMGIETGCDLFKLMDMAEDIIFPLMDHIVRVDRSSLTLGFAGVYSTFLLHANRASQRFGIPARDILVELGRKKMIGGQEDMIIDTAMTMAKERGLLKDAAAGVTP